MEITVAAAAVVAMDMVQATTAMEVVVAEAMAAVVVQVEADMEVIKLILFQIIYTKFPSPYDGHAFNRNAHLKVMGYNKISIKRTK